MPTPTPLVARFRRGYGAGPAHLVLLLAALALAVHTVRTLGLDALWDPEVWWQSIAVWFIGAAVVHDLVLYPATAAVDTVITRATRRRPGRRRGSVPVVNFVRVPLLACALVTVLFLPGIIRHGADTYQRATGQTQDPFLLRWALLCSAFLLLGLAAYGLARVRAARRTTSEPAPPEPPTRRPVATVPPSSGRPPGGDFPGRPGKSELGGRYFGRQVQGSPVDRGETAPAPAPAAAGAVARWPGLAPVVAALVAVTVVVVVLVRRRGRA
ncbi:hypothetical protein [Nocardioides dongxiaopingii]|uniref:hypothetical protein n=1 Tax=Nocardioides dongxiaopingii TaxID=2576036 RepID=UPI001BAEF60A|nr:hypothetical protein [Nocardioides dongxiaopingii]